MMGRPKQGLRTAPQRSRIVRPFFVTLSLLLAAALALALRLVTPPLVQTVDERLAMCQQALFRSLRTQEQLLLVYGQLAASARHLSAAATDQNPAAAALEAALTDQRITLDLYRSLPPSEEEFAPLLRQAAQGGTPRFQLVTNRYGKASLAVAVPVPDSPELLLLRTPLGDAFLYQFGNSFQTSISLLDLDGSAVGGRPPHLTPLKPAELERIRKGERLLVQHAGDSPSRILYQAVPLGTADMIIAAVEAPTDDIAATLQNMALQAGAVLLLALLLGAYAYRRLVRLIAAPAAELLQATREVGAGNLDYRIGYRADDEMGQVASSFNEMLVKLGELHRGRTEEEKKRVLAQSELRHKEIIEEKDAAIERANRELSVQNKELSGLLQLNQAMISSLDLEVLFDGMIRVLTDLFDCDETAILLYNRGDEKLVVRQCAGPRLKSYPGLTIRLDEGVVGLAARSKTLQHVPDIAVDSRNLNHKGKTAARGALISAPLIVKERLKGVLNLYKVKSNSFSDLEIRLIQAIANQAAIAIENVELYNRARDLSNTDELTGLPNRRFFEHILQREQAQAKRYTAHFSLIIADIDHFKAFNDAHGKLSGDAVLKRVASILKHNIRAIDLVARYGGEEFIILLPKTGKDGARTAAEKLRKCILDEAFSIAEKSQEQGYLTLSLGVAEFPTDSKDPEELIGLARRALTLAQQQGHNRTTVWNAGTIPFRPRPRQHHTPQS